MFRELAEVWKYRELLMNLVLRDIKVRYKNSVLGFFWSLLNPLLQVATITFVFKGMLGMGTPNYSAYLLCAFLPWTFFQMSILDASMSVLMNYPLVKKTYFPREILPVSIVLSNLVHFVCALGVFFIYMRILGTPILATWLLLPVLVVIQLLMNLGIAFFVSALNVFYEDIKYVVTVVMNLLFFLMPVMYVVENSKLGHRLPEPLGTWMYNLYFINPLSFLLTAYRKIMLPPLPNNIPMSYWYLALAAVNAVIIFVLGYAFFNKRKWSFAERL